jgi:hypothetical protein
MKRPTAVTPKSPPLYARIRNVPDLYAKHLVVPKCHALRDEFSKARAVVGATKRKPRTSLLMEGEPFRHALRGKLGGTQTLKILYALRIESLRPDGGTSVAREGGPGYGR